MNAYILKDVPLISEIKEITEFLIIFSIFLCPRDTSFQKYVTQQGVYHSFHFTEPHIDIKPWRCRDSR